MADDESVTHLINTFHINFGNTKQACSRWASYYEGLATGAHEQVKLSIGSHQAVALSEPCLIWYRVVLLLCKRFNEEAVSHQEVPFNRIIFTTIAVACNHKGVTWIAILGWSERSLLDPCLPFSLTFMGSW